WRQMVKSGHEAAGAVWYAPQAKAHFNAAQRAGEHEIVERAEMADSKHLAGELAKSGSERHVEVPEDHVPKAIGIVPLRHHDRGQRTGVLERFLTDDFQPPSLYRRTSRLGVP